MCISVQKPQPLIWLARSFTSPWMAIGRAESRSTASAALMCLTTFIVRGLLR